MLIIIRDETCQRILMRDFDLVIRGGTVVNATSTARCDIGILDGRIVALAENLEGGRERIDAAGLLIVPGGIDSHVHLEQPTGQAIMADDFASGSRSAAFGGNTMLLAFGLQPKGGSLEEAVREYHASAASKTFLDFNFHPIITEASEAVLQKELPQVIRNGHRSLKVFMTYNDLRLGDEEILQLFVVARREGALVLIHAENHDVITVMTKRLVAEDKLAPRYHVEAHAVVAEEEATRRVLALAEWADVPIAILHVSTRGALEAIQQAQQRGQKVFAETCPQYLVFDPEDLENSEAAKLVFSPPPRQETHRNACWEGLASGVLATVSSDHCPFRFEGPGGKQPGNGKIDFRAIPNGIPGVETRLPILFSEGVGQGRISLNQFVALSSTNHARIYGLFPQKGLIGIGSDADLVFWDPTKKVTLSQSILHHDCDYTPYEGMQVTGWPIRTLLRGKTIVSDGELLANSGSGRFQKQIRINGST
jgi:dihydropyrimidinase